jgi:hypothetical protein
MKLFECILCLSACEFLEDFLNHLLFDGMDGFEDLRGMSQ